MFGYVTFVNKNDKYLKLTELLIESVLMFSQYKIEIFAINFDYTHSSNRVLSRRIDIQNENFETICYSKLYSTYNSIFDCGVQLDSDMILTRKTDLLFSECQRIKDTPLGSLHPCDPNNQGNIMNILGVNEKTQPYVHATYLFSNSCKNFFKECYDISQHFLKKSIRPANYDETIYNVMLWKYGSIDYVDCYDPYYEVFLDNNTKNIHGYNNMKINNYICHGQKNYSESLKILELIKTNDIK